MVSQEQSTQTDPSLRRSRQLCGLTLKDVLKFVASLLLPLALGVFTLVITLQQQQLAKQQRDEDRNASLQQRIEDRNASLQQRIEDKNAAERLRELERNLTNERYQNEVLDAYVKEMGELLKEYNGSLISNDFATTIARAKTLNIFRKLDSHRNVRIISFLYEAKQLTETVAKSPLDLSTAEFHDMDFRGLAVNKKRLSNISLTASVNFSRARTPHTDFQQTTCIAARFDYADLQNSNFWYSNVKHASFIYTTLVDTDFLRANLYKAIFSDTKITDGQLQSALSIQDALLPNKTFSQDTNLINNGHADCNSSLVNSWTLLTGNIVPIMSDANNTNCRFTLRSIATGASMLQRINLSSKWDSNYWSYSQAILNATMSNGVSIQLSGLSSTEGTYASQNLVPLRASLIDIPPNARWNKNDRPVGGQNLTLYRPLGLYVDDEQTIYVADYGNHRIAAWKSDEINGQIVAGGHRGGNSTHQLNWPTDVIVDKERDSLIICDQVNKRVVRCSRQNGTSEEIIISDISCWSLTMDENGFLYVTDVDKHEVRRYRMAESQAIVVAGGNGEGNRLDQLNFPTCIFVDREHSVFVSDEKNHRVMKWIEGAKEGIVVAGGQGQGDSLTPLFYPNGVVVDQLGAVYVADQVNHRIVRWLKGAQQGNVIVGGNGRGAQANQLNFPEGLSFDQQGNLYVADWGNNRVQRFNIEIP